MSGGSYNYLYSQDLHSISIEDLERMVEKLSALGASKAARDTQMIILLHYRFENEFNEAVNPLRDLWRIAEWEEDFDVSRESLMEAINEYNQLKTKKD